MIAYIIAVINAVVRQMCDTGKPDPRAVAVAIEANQRYIEYLDELLDGPIPVTTAGRAFEDNTWTTSSK